MYRLAEDNELINHARQFCSCVAKNIEHILKEEYNISSQVFLVGSAKRKLQTCNGNNKSFDFDYNIVIKNAMAYDARWLKEQVRLAFNKSLSNACFQWGVFTLSEMSLFALRCNTDVHDSTSALTSKPMSFYSDYSRTFHIDISILTKEDGYWHRLKNDKTAQQYIWNKMANIDDFKKREQSLTFSEQNELRQLYVEKKNLHIQDEENFPSFKCYIEAVNEIYFKRNRK